MNDFPALAGRLQSNGYRPIPIMPRDKRPSVAGWRTWHPVKVDTYKGHGVGIVCGHVLGIDIDVRDPALSDVIGDMFSAAFGKAPCRVGLPPKQLLLVRTVAPLAKVMTRAFTLPSDQPGDKAHRVEVLGEGQQLVAFGIHPDTGLAYSWTDASPLDTPLAELPLLSHADVERFIRDCDALLAQHGKAVGSLHIPKARSSDNPELLSRNAVLTIEALQHIPNDSNTDWDFWMKIGMAVKGALGDDGIEHWLAWSRQSDKHNERAAQDLYRSAAPASVGAGTIHHLAKENGWTPVPVRAKPTQRPQHIEAWEIPGPREPTVARALLHHRWPCDERSMGGLIRYRDNWYSYRNGFWYQEPNEKINRLALLALEHAYYVKDGQRKFLHLDQRHRAGIADALTRLAAMASDNEPPLWLAGEQPYPHAAGELLHLQNGLLHAATCALYPHTPHYFTRTQLPVSYEPESQCPRWEQFLAETYDAECIAELQKWFGYVLTNDTSRQKFLILSGPPGSGKSVTLNVMTELLGKLNCASSSLSSFGQEFGLAPMLGKTLCVFPDVRDSSFNALAVEHLLSVVGEDTISVNVKHHPHVITALPTRLAFGVNAMPRLPDSANALMRRILLLPAPNTVPPERRDADLLPKLYAELPGILNWALKGLTALYADGFKQPTSGAQSLADFRRLASPILEFVTDCCVIDPKHVVPCEYLYLQWSRWRDQRGHQPTADSVFGRDLRSVVPTLERTRRRVDGKVKWHFVGIDMNPDAILMG